jgi:hypothetical protein
VQNAEAVVGLISNTCVKDQQKNENISEMITAREELSTHTIQLETMIKSYLTLMRITCHIEH